MAGEMLEEMGVDAEIVKAVKAHNSYTWLAHGNTDGPCTLRR